MSVRDKWEGIYSSARYEVMLEDESLVFSIGDYDANAEQRLVAETGMQRDWTIITPCNPRSDLAREELNLFYFNELRYELEARAGFWFKALNRDPSGQFPDEPGFCVIDADREWMMNLGRRFYQNALVTAAIGSAPRLLWLEK
jgi:hypothetical protein